MAGVACVRHSRPGRGHDSVDRELDLHAFGRFEGRLPHPLLTLDPREGSLDHPQELYARFVSGSAGRAAIEPCALALGAPMGARHNPAAARSMLGSIIVSTFQRGRLGGHRRHGRPNPVPHEPRRAGAVIRRGQQLRRRTSEVSGPRGFTAKHNLNTSLRPDWEGLAITFLVGCRGESGYRLCQPRSCLNKQRTLERGSGIT